MEDIRIYPHLPEKRYVLAGCRIDWSYFGRLGRYGHYNLNIFEKPVRFYYSQIKIHWQWSRSRNLRFLFQSILRRWGYISRVRGGGASGAALNEPGLIFGDNKPVMALGGLDSGCGLKGPTQQQDRSEKHRTLSSPDLKRWLFNEF